MEQQLTAEQLAAIDRIAKVLETAKRVEGNEAEAAVAMDIAVKLAEAYNLDMALIERRSGSSSARKREDQKSGGGLYKWQRTVWKEVSDLNFCRYVSVRGLSKGSKYENRVIGSQVNVMSTSLMADYLQTTIERLAAEWVRDTYGRGTSRFITEAIQWREGCADRIAERLRNLRWEREDERKRERDAQPRGDGTALILADVVDAENDANDDLLYDLEPGTHAKWRVERNARRMAAEAAHRMWQEERDAAEATDPALKEKRLAKEAADKAKADKENERFWAKRGRKAYAYRETAEDRRKQGFGYQAGREAGRDIGLDPQVDNESAKRRLLK